MKRMLSTFAIFLLCVSLTSCNSSKGDVGNAIEELGFTVTNLSVISTKDKVGEYPVVEIDATVSESMSKEEFQDVWDAVLTLYVADKKFPQLTVSDASGNTYNFDDVDREEREQNYQSHQPESPSYILHTDDDAFLCAKDIVEDSLKAPSTAKFCKLSDATITRSNNGDYIVRGWVEAENSYGAMLRSDFVVTYTPTESGYKNGSAIIE